MILPGVPGQLSLRILQAAAQHHVWRNSTIVRFVHPGLMWHSPVAFMSCLALMSTPMACVRLALRAGLVAALGGLLFACSVCPPLRAQSRAQAPSADQQTHARQLLVRGMTQAFLDDHAAAITHFEKALEIVPGEAAVLSALSDSHAAQDNLSSALFYAQQAYVRAPATPHYGMRLAALHRRDGRPADAVSTYREMLDRKPDLLAAREALAATLTEMGNLQRAAEAYERLLEASREPRPDIQLDVLRLYRSLDNREGVERTLQALIDLRPTDPLYRRMLGELYIRQGRVQEAIAIYEGLADATPSDTDLMLQLATLYRQDGQTARAEALLDRFMGRPGTSPERLVAQARRLLESAPAASAGASSPDSTTVQAALRMVRTAQQQAPDNSEVLATLGRIHLRMGNPAAAAPLLRRAVEINPRAVDRWAVAAEAYTRARQPQQAISVAEEGLMLFPGQYALVRALARALLEAHQNQAALERYREALSMLDASENPSEAAALHTAIGRLLDRLSRRDDAAAAYEQAFALAPESPTTAAYYALHLAETRTRLADAAAYAERAVAATDSSMASLHALGWVEFRRGRHGVAKTLLERVVGDSSASARAYEHLGDVHRAQGNARAAQRAWEQALERAPRDSSLREKLNAAQSMEK